MRRHRYKCLECEKTFVHRPSELHPTRNITRHLQRWIWEQSLRRHFADVAHDVGLSETTVQAIFMSEFEDRERDGPRPFPQWVGIDEVYLLSKRRSNQNNKHESSDDSKGRSRDKRAQCILVDLSNGRVYDLLPDQKADTVRAALARMKEAGHTPGGFTMDMHDGYRAAVREVFPNAEIVADAFHVTSQINDVFTRARTDLQGKLTRAAKEPSIEGELGTKEEVHDLKGNAWRFLRRPGDLEDAERSWIEEKMHSHPVLGTVYKAKEDLYEIYHTHDREEAIRR